MSNGLSSPEIFGHAPDGAPVYRITLENGGTRASVISWGASLQDLRTERASHPLILGSERFEDYLGPMRYFGAVIGPVANRIAKGRAPLGGHMLELEKNENNLTSLHSGSEGSSHRNWDIISADKRHCLLRLFLPEGAGGIPGPITLETDYSLLDTGALEVTLRGKSQTLTFCNMAHHPYWNLSGASDITDHALQIEADQYLPVDNNNIPLGAPQAVAGTAFDYRKAQSPKQEKILLDHNFCLSGAGFRDICTLTAGYLTLTLASDAPGLQVYHGADIDTPTGLNGQRYGNYAGLALEPQYWPDAPNQKGYPSIELSPGEEFSQRTRYTITASE